MLKDKVWRTCAFWIWKDKYPTTMFYCFTSSIQQVSIVRTLFASCAIDIRLALHGMEFAIVDNLLQLLNETGTFQIVQFL